MTNIKHFEGEHQVTTKNLKFLPHLVSRIVVALLDSSITKPNLQLRNAVIWEAVISIDGKYINNENGRCSLRRDNAHKYLWVCTYQEHMQIYLSGMLTGNKARAHACIHTKKRIFIYDKSKSIYEGIDNFE